MREILFRGKRADNGEWIKGSLLKVTISGKTYWLIFTDNFAQFNAEIKAVQHACVDPATVGQYTGLTDKNGVMIFEGDILEHHVQGDILVNRGVVEWDDCDGRWAHQLNTMSPSFCMCNSSAIEVIGNIYDNPELMDKVTDDV